MLVKIWRRVRPCRQRYRCHPEEKNASGAVAAHALSPLAHRKGALDDTGRSYFQLNYADYWPRFGYDLMFGQRGALGSVAAFCSNQGTYQAASNSVCGGGVNAFGDTVGLGAWGAAESEMEMWYAL